MSIQEYLKQQDSRGKEKNSSSSNSSNTDNTDSTKRNNTLFKVEAKKHSLNYLVKDYVIKKNILQRQKDQCNDMNIRQVKDILHQLENIEKSGNETYKHKKIELELYKTFYDLNKDKKYTEEELFSYINDSECSCIIPYLKIKSLIKPLEFIDNINVDKFRLNKKEQSQFDDILFNSKIEHKIFDIIKKTKIKKYRNNRTTEKFFKKTALYEDLKQFIIQTLSEKDQSNNTTNINYKTEGKIIKKRLLILSCFLNEFTTWRDSTIEVDKNNIKNLKSFFNIGITTPFITNLVNADICCAKSVIDIARSIGLIIPVTFKEKLLYLNNKIDSKFNVSAIHFYNKTVEIIVKDLIKQYSIRIPEEFEKNLKQARIGITVHENKINDFPEIFKQFKSLTDESKEFHNILSNHYSYFISELDKCRIKKTDPRSIPDLLEVVEPDIEEYRKLRFKDAKQLFNLLNINIYTNTEEDLKNNINKVFSFFNFFIQDNQIIESIRISLQGFCNFCLSLLQLCYKKNNTNNNINILTDEYIYFPNEELQMGLRVQAHNKLKNTFLNYLNNEDIFILFWIIPEKIQSKYLMDISPNYQQYINNCSFKEFYKNLIKINKKQLEDYKIYDQSDLSNLSNLIITRNFFNLKIKRKESDKYKLTTYTKELTKIFKISNVFNDSNISNSNNSKLLKNNKLESIGFRPFSNMAIEKKSDRYEILRQNLIITYQNEYNYKIKNNNSPVSSSITEIKEIIDYLSNHSFEDTHVRQIFLSQKDRNGSILRILFCNEDITEFCKDIYNFSFNSKSSIDMFSNFRDNLKLITLSIIQSNSLNILYLLKNYLSKEEKIQLLKLIKRSKKSLNLKNNINSDIFRLESMFMINNSLKSKKNQIIIYDELITIKDIEDIKKQLKQNNYNKTTHKKIKNNSYNNNIYHYVKKIKSVGIEDESVNIEKNIEKDLKTIRNLNYMLNDVRELSP